MARYKYLNYLPVPVKLDPRFYDLVNDEVFNTIDGRIPLHNVTMEGIFPSMALFEDGSKMDYSELEDLLGQRIGFIGREDLSDREYRDVFELFIDFDTIDLFSTGQLLIDLDLWDKKGRLNCKNPDLKLDKGRCSIASASEGPSTDDAPVTYSVKPLIELRPKERLPLIQEKQTIVKFSIIDHARSKYYGETPKATQVSLRPGTYLQCNQTNAKCSLVYSQGINKWPESTLLGPDRTFLLVFSGLPSSCLSFNLVKEAPSINSKVIPDIPRNRSGVYRLWI